MEVGDKTACMVILILAAKLFYLLGLDLTGLFASHVKFIRTVLYSI